MSFPNQCMTHITVGKPSNRFVARAACIALSACLSLSGCHRASTPPPTSSTPDTGKATTQHPAERPEGGTTPDSPATAGDQPLPGVFGMINDPDTTVLRPVDVKSLTESQRKFGIAPKRSAQVEYQPGVLIMEHGDEAIRSLANDGMSWQFDAHAPQVDQFKEGKIVFATGLAVGRILSLKAGVDVVTVVLGPVQLTDVIKRGKFAMNEPIDVSNVIAYTAPDFPQPAETTYPFGSATSDIQQAPARFYTTGFYATQAQVTPGIIQIPQPPTPLPAIPTADSLGKLPVVNIDSDVRSVPVLALNKVGAQLYYYKKGGPSVFAEATMSITKLQVRFVLDIEDSTIIECGIHVDGAVGLGLQLNAITYGKDFRVNVDRKLWVPVDLKIPLGLNGAIPVPFSVTFNTMLELHTGFSARNATLSAEGDYTFGGGLFAGYKKAGGWQVSTSKDPVALKDIGLTTKGVSVGIDSLILSASERVMVGIGAFGFNTGVYGGLRFGGTVLAAPTNAWACRQGTIGAYFDYGVGYSLPPAFTEAVNFFLKSFTHYQLDRVGDILQGKPPETILTGRTESPKGCASQSGST